MSDEEEYDPVEEAITDMIEKAVAEYAPHGPDSVRLSWPTYAAHIEICGGVTKIEIAAKLAKQMVTEIEDQLSEGGSKAVDTSWATGLDVSKGN